MNITHQRLIDMGFGDCSNGWYLYPDYHRFLKKEGDYYYYEGYDDKLSKIHHVQNMHFKLTGLEIG